MKKSIIGRTYIPYDNSWAVNVTKCGSHPYENKQSYLGGSYNTYPKECTIVSEPFKCNTYSFGINNPYGVHEMIMVDYEGETHMVLFHENCIVK